MKITIDEKVCLKHKMTLEEVLYALVYRQIKDLGAVFDNMVDREILVLKDNEPFVTQHWSDVLDEILCDSSQGCSKTDEELINLALRVMECFPKGLKMKDRFGRETPYFYRCNKSEVSKALKRFFTQFGSSYSDDEIVDAAKRYVASFNGNYTGMRLVKYFIMKNPIKQGEDGKGYVEQVSDLLTFLENKESDGGVEVTNSDEWLMNSRN